MGHAQVGEVAANLALQQQPNVAEGLVAAGVARLGPLQQRLARALRHHDDAVVADREALPQVRHHRLHREGHLGDEQQVHVPRRQGGVQRQQAAVPAHQPDNADTCVRR